LIDFDIYESGRKKKMGAFVTILDRIQEGIEGLARVHRLLPWLLAWIILLPLPFILQAVFSEYFVDLTNRICLFILLAVGLNIVKGFCGQVTVGHIGLYAIGAVTSAVLALEPGVFGGTWGFGWPVWAAIPMAVLVTALAGVVVGLPSVRLEGAYLALATLGLGESVRIMIAVTPAFGSSTGLMLIPPPVIGGFVFDSFNKYYYLVMTAALVGIYFSFSILRSATGRAFMAVREDTIAASVNGINVAYYKLLAFVISAIYAGLAGALFAHMPPGYLHHNNFTVIEMVTLLLMVVLGGIGNVWGGVIGAIVVAIAYDQTKDLVITFMDRPVIVQPIVFGLAMVFLVLFMPRGIGGWIEGLQRTRRFIRRSEEKISGTS
jgi:branched-chain amino acid transport system permease protein